MSSANNKLTKFQRIKVKRNLIKQLDNLKLYPDEFIQIKELHVRLNVFIEKGNNDSGIINLPRLNRNIIYNFSNTKYSESYISLKFIN